jgi:hypothetical protein
VKEEHAVAGGNFVTQKVSCPEIAHTIESAAATLLCQQS